MLKTNEHINLKKNIYIIYLILAELTVVNFKLLITNYIINLKYELSIDNLFSISFITTFFGIFFGRSSSNWFLH